MSGSGANFPVAVTLQGADTTEAALRRIADRVQETFVANAQLAQQTPAALGRVSEAFGTLEQRTQRARGAVNDLKGSMELLGAGNVAGVLGSVGGTVGNLADAFGTAVRIAESFGGTLAMLGRFALPAGAALAAIALATTDWGEATDKVSRGLQDLRGVSYDANTATEAYGRGITSLIALLETAADRERRLAAETRQRIINTMMGEEQTVRGQLGPARARLAELQPTADQVALARQVAGPDTALPANIQRRMAEYDRVLADVRRMEAQAAGLEAGMRDLSQIPYGSPASVPGAPPEAYGPPAPPREAGGGRGGSGRDPISDMVDRAVERAREQQARDEERARQQRQRDEERALERMQRANERTTDAIVSYSADRFADLWNGTGDGFQKLMDSLYRTAINTFARIASEAIIRPIVAPIVSDLGLGGLAQAGTGGGGGLGDLLGLGGSLNSLTGGGIGEMLGLSGGVGGLLAAPLFGSGALTSSTTSALAAMGPGVYGPAAPSALGLGGATLGGAFTGIGGGFALGSLTSQLTARSAAQRTNGMIGSGIGAAAGFLVGGPIGGLLGGAAGGAIGGLFGPSRSASGGDVQIQIDGAGRLVAGRAAGKNFDTGALSQQAQQQVAALNQQLAAAGLRLPGNGDLGWIGGGGSTNPGDVGTLLARSGVGVRADDARIQGVLDRRGITDIGGAVGVAQEVRAFVATLDGLKAATAEVTDPLEAVRRSFDALFVTAGQLGFGLDEVTAAQERALDAVRKQQREQAAGQAAPIIGGLADYARGLRTANDNSGNPITRFAAAESQFGDVAARALGGDFRALSRLQSSAETFRGLARQVYGTGGSFAAAEDRIASVLDQVGAIGEDRLTASVLDASVQRQTDTLVDSLASLRAEVTALRRDVQQGQANPLAGRTA
jgi:hypothetical protein